MIINRSSLIDLQSSIQITFSESCCGKATCTYENLVDAPVLLSGDGEAVQVVTAGAKQYNAVAEAAGRHYVAAACGSSEVEARQRIARHYSGRCQRSEREQEKSPIVQLKKLHGWIKGSLIASVTERGDLVVDLACGKGGDLGRWGKAGVGGYIGVDIVEELVEVARARQRQRGEGVHHARFICADAYGPDLLRHVRAVAADVCSCQFALHYAWSSQERARLALSNVASLLKPGGYFIGTLPDAGAIAARLRRRLGDVGGGGGGVEFGNEVYKVRFDAANCDKAAGGGGGGGGFGIQYEFYLEDAVTHCPEWMVPMDSLVAVARDCGLHLLSAHNFHNFLLAERGALPNISPAEWDCVSLYLTFVFKKLT